MKRNIFFACIVLLTNSIAYSQEARKIPTADEIPLVIVNAGNLDRAGIADLLTHVNRQKPKAVGINFTFGEKREGDEKLIEALKGSPNLVLNCHEENGVLTKSYFTDFEYGQANMHRNHHGEIDYFPPVLDVNGEKIEHFGLKILRYVDPEKYRILHEELSHLSTKHKVTFMKIDFLPHNLTSFQTIDHADLKKAPKDLFQGKVVLIGYLGDKIDNTRFVTDEEDAFMVPVKHHHHEKNPMYATVILANIIQTLIRGEMKSFHHGQGQGQ